MTSYSHKFDSYNKSVCQPYRNVHPSSGIVFANLGTRYFNSWYLHLYCSQKQQSLIGFLGCPSTWKDSQLAQSTPQPQGGGGGGVADAILGFHDKRGSPDQQTRKPRLVCHALIACHQWHSVPSRRLGREIHVAAPFYRGLGTFY